MDAIKDTEFITLPQAARKVPRINGRNINPRTVYRWVTHGVMVDGHQVLLDSRRIGGINVTTVDWLRDFLESTARSVEGSENDG